MTLRAKHVIVYVFCLWMCMLEVDLPAWAWEPFVDISVGYRQDKIDCQSMTYDVNGDVVSKSDLNESNIRLVEIGASGGLGFCEDWLLLADVNVGKVISGEYAEEIVDFGSSKINSKIACGNSQDISFNVAYCPCFFSWVRLGPTAGWSYHVLRTTMRHLPTSANPNADTHHVTYKNQWQGPWAGLTLATSFCKVALYSDYEYHWPNWRAAWTPSEPDISGVTFADRRKSHHGNGQVVRIGAAYSLCGGWDIGFGLKYQIWKATQGSINPRSGSFSDVGSLLVQREKVIKTKWRSIEGRVTLAYQF